MFQIRYKNNECTDQEKINRFLTKTRIGFLGLASRDMPYVVPLNYVWFDGKIYFHGAAEGRKVDVIKENNDVCFTVCEEYGTLVSPIPAHTSTAYMSAMVFGKIEPVTDLEEATLAMQKMLDKYVPGYHKSPLAKNHVKNYRSSLGSKTVVYRITASQVTAKEEKPDEEKLFYEGRSVEDDV